MIDLFSLAELPIVTHPVTITGRDVRFAWLLLEVKDVIFTSAAVMVEHSSPERRILLDTEKAHEHVYPET